MAWNSRVTYRHPQGGQRTPGDDLSVDDPWGSLTDCWEAAWDEGWREVAEGLPELTPEVLRELMRRGDDDVR